MEIINVQVNVSFGEINQTRREKIMNDLNTLVTNKSEIFNISKNVPIDVNFDTDIISVTISFDSLDSLPNYQLIIKILIESVFKTLMFNHYNFLQFSYTNREVIEKDIKQPLLNLLDMDTSHYRGLGIKAAINKNGVHADAFYEPSYNVDKETDNSHERYYQFVGGFDEFTRGDFSAIRYLDEHLEKFVTQAKEELNELDRYFLNKNGESYECKREN